MLIWLVYIWPWLIIAALLVALYVILLILERKKKKRNKNLLKQNLVSSLELRNKEKEGGNKDEE